MTAPAALAKYKPLLEKILQHEAEEVRYLTIHTKDEDITLCLTLEFWDLYQADRITYDADIADALSDMAIECENYEPPGWEHWEPSYTTFEELIRYAEKTLVILKSGVDDSTLTYKEMEGTYQ